MSNKSATFFLHLGGGGNSVPPLKLSVNFTLHPILLPRDPVFLLGHFSHPLVQQITNLCLLMLFLCRQEGRSAKQARVPAGKRGVISVTCTRQFSSLFSFIRQAHADCLRLCLEHALSWLADIISPSVMTALSVDSDHRPYAGSASHTFTPQGFCVMAFTNHCHGHQPCTYIVISALSEPIIRRSHPIHPDLYDRLFKPNWPTAEVPSTIIPSTSNQTRILSNRHGASQ